MKYEKTLLVILLSLSYLSVKAEVGYGLKGVFNYSNFSITDSKDVKLGGGFSFGGFVRYALEDHSWWYLELDGLFSHRNSNVTLKGDNEMVISFKYQYSGISFPLYACIKKNIKKGSLFIGLGPYLSYNFDVMVQQLMNDGYVNESKDNYKQIDSGLATIFGYNINKHWQINAGYQLGILDLNHDEKIKMFSTLTYAGLAYRF